MFKQAFRMKHWWMHALVITIYITVIQWPSDEMHDAFRPIALLFVSLVWIIHITALGVLGTFEKADKLHAEQAEAHLQRKGLAISTIFLGIGALLFLRYLLS
ncbi:MAG TPA: hypothetical protein VLG69_03230 [Candidatus Andersenbacteria bacterium]|nr:hypothetical protein [Candidatus Andersenbacteria bacterium]